MDVTLTIPSLNSLETKLFLNWDLQNKFFSNLHPQSSKDFWKIIKSLNPSECFLLPLKSENTIVNSSLDKASLLNNIFTNHYNRSVPELSISDIPEDVPADRMST